MRQLHLEFMIEPFVAGRPGAHVRAAVEAASAAGLEVEMGPFGSLASATLEEIATATDAVLRAAFAAGATRVTLAVGDARPIAATDLNGALARMLAEVEAELGAPLAALDRDGKQTAVRTLDERGAFTLRRSIEDVADALGVSRVTVYHYLDAIRGD